MPHICKTIHLLDMIGDNALREKELRNAFACLAAKLYIFYTVLSIRLCYV